MPRPLVLCWLVAMSLLACQPGCKKQAPPATADQPKVRITLDWKPEPEFGGFYQAQLDGSYKNHHLDVELKTAGEGAPTWQLVASGQTEFATTSADQVLIARSRGADVVALFAVYQTFPQGIMVHKARGFTKIDDVFSNPGTLAAEDNAWLKYLLNKFGPGQVKVTGYSGGVSLFLAKPDYSQQCFVTSEPISAKRQGGDPQTFLISDAGYNPYTTVLITSRKLAQQKPQLVMTTLAAVREGWTAYLADPAAANASMGALNKDMDAQTFADAAAAQKPFIETDETRANGIGSMTLDRWKTLSQQLTDLKVIEKAPPADECFIQ